MTETRKRVTALVLAAMLATAGAFAASAVTADEARAAGSTICHTCPGSD